MKELERNYLKAMFVTFVIILLGAVVSLIYSLVIIFQTDAITNNILELLYMVIHIIAAFLGLSFVINALKSDKGSYIMKNLMHKQGTTVPSVVARVVAIVLSTLGLFGGVYFSLVLAGVPLPSFHFPIALVLDLINSPFTVFIIGLYFIFYPFIYSKCQKEGTL